MYSSYKCNLFKLKSIFLRYMSILIDFGCPLIMLFYLLVFKDFFFALFGFPNI